MLAYVPIAKVATQLVAGLGVSKILHDIVGNNVAIATPVQAVTVRVGGFVLSSILIQQSSDHIEKATHSVVAWIENHKADNTTTK